MNTWIEQNVLPPMLINHAKSESDLAERLESGAYYGTKKVDGALYQLTIDPDGEAHLFSRTVSKKTGFFVDKIDNVPHLKEFAERTLPKDTVLLGEIYYPGGTSKDTVSIMGCLPQKAVERQKDNPIHYYLFDALKIRGYSLLSEGNLRRISALQSYLETIKIPSWLEFSTIYQDNLETVLDRMFNEGEEGMVFRQVNGKYAPGKRPVYNIKAKTEDTVDAIVTNLLDPTREYTGKDLLSWSYWEAPDGAKRINEGKPEGDWVPVTKPYFRGWKTAIEVSALKDGIAVPIATVSSGMTDLMRSDAAKNPSNYIGKVAEIQCMSKDRSALSLRHPRLVEIRDVGDKSIKDCTVESVFGR